MSNPPLMQSPPGPHVVVDGREYLYFAGTSYLGLHADPRVIEAAMAALRQFGMGTATSRSGFGNSEPMLEVERAAAALMGTEDAFYFPSGYMGATIIATALRGHHDAILIDEQAHYSIIDACRSAARPSATFRHCDAGSLEQVLTASKAKHPLVMTDGLFALSGDVPPLGDYCTILRRFDSAALYVDDAHALGVLGDHGRGSFDAAGFGPREVNCGGRDGLTLWSSATLSKAAGGYGGVIAGANDVIAHLKRDMPWYSGASPLPPSIAAGTAMGLRIMLDEPQHRRRMRDNAALLRRHLAGAGFDVPPGTVPIFALRLGDAANMQRIQQTLRDRGVMIAYFPRYAGSGEHGVLRLAVFATHTPGMIEHLVDELVQAAHP